MHLLDLKTFTLYSWIYYFVIINHNELIIKSFNLYLHS